MAMVPYVIIMYLGNIIVSVGYDNKWPWEAIVVVGFTCAGIQVAALPSIASTYAVDSYKPVAGSLFVSTLFAMLCVSCFGWDDFTYESTGEHHCQ